MLALACPSSHLLFWLLLRSTNSTLLFVVFVVCWCCFLVAKSERECTAFVVVYFQCSPVLPPFRSGGTVHVILTNYIFLRDCILSSSSANQPRTALVQYCS